MSEENGRVFVVESNQRDDIIKIAIMIMLLIIFPPLAVGLKANECNSFVLISLILYLFGGIPSYIFAIWFCFVRKSDFPDIA